MHPDETIRSRPIRDSQSIPIHAQEPEILRILNWPVESRRGALVEGGGSSCCRRLSPQCRCLSLHLDHVSSPRSSNQRAVCQIDSLRSCGFDGPGAALRNDSRTDPSAHLCGPFRLRGSVCVTELRQSVASERNPCVLRPLRLAPVWRREIALRCATVHGGRSATPCSVCRSQPTRAGQKASAALRRRNMR